MSRRRSIPVALAAIAMIAVAAGPVPVGARTAEQAKSKPTKVKVRDDFYAPDEVTIKKKEKVKWVWGNANIDAHDVKLKKGPQGAKNFRSLTASIGYSFTHKFKKKGLYDIYCTLHPTVMEMTVDVK
jgi:plastocyanin